MKLCRCHGREREACLASTRHALTCHVGRSPRPMAQPCKPPFHSTQSIGSPSASPPHTQIRRPRSPSRNRRARSQPSVTQPLINYLFIFPPIYRCRRWLTKQNRSITSSLLLPSPSPILSPTSRFESCEQFIPIGFDPVTS